MIDALDRPSETTFGKEPCLSMIGTYVSMTPVVWRAFWDSRQPLGRVWASA